MLNAQQFFTQVIEIQYPEAMNNKFRCMQLYAEYVVNIYDQRAKRASAGDK